MSIQKEILQKILLISLLSITGLYAYVSLLIGPLLGTESNEKRLMSGLSPKIAAAKTQIQKTKNLESRIPEITDKTHSMFARLPEGAPVAWFPPKISEFFKQNGIEKILVRVSGEPQDSEIPGFRRFNWSIEFPKVDFLEFAGAMALLENSEPLLDLNAIQLERDAEDPLSQRATISASLLVRQ